MELSKRIESKLYFALRRCIGRGQIRALGNLEALGDMSDIVIWSFEIPDVNQTINYKFTDPNS